MDYRQAGVDIEAGYESVRLIKDMIARTKRPEVVSDIGGFSGAFSMEAFKDMEEPTLVSGTDGVGTKLKLAFLMDRHDTVGIDCVAMCVNDIACAGGEPLFFLDYIACGKNVPEKIAQIVKGVSEGCLQAGADWRRDGGDAGVLSGGRIRPGRICGWRLRPEKDDHRAVDPPWRCPCRNCLKRGAQQWLFPRAQGLFDG